MIVAALALAACAQTPVADKASAPLRTMTASQLRVVPVTASIDLALQASVYAWRDFMPAITDSTKVPELSVSVQVRGGVVPPKALSCDAIYLLMADSVYSARPAEQRAGDGPGAVECLLRGGPAWDVGATVQVIISVSSGSQQALIRRETTIDATS